ncbi:hypothetical protein BKA62DRAFT_147390 [Auriculariales sp. MPI-PUGE-AT-0066]|nr:hypothetical protein BKA62DRAFT_147390 [Auriculariales sp. MPI-PUGE-AT-0066]
MHAVIATGSGLELSLPQYIVTSRQQPGSASSSSSSTGSPPPATPLDTPQAAFAQVAVQQDAAHADAAHADASLAPKARPKTSHTTIERRYRTNLNARIVALRAAVPATAHLDTPGSVTLDTRGRADGVTPARKGSKATILAKAVEYITVLKAREIRLRRDTDGLRNLVRGLVGGDQLLNAWEASWKQRWGTMEDDEARLAGDAVGGSDDEDSDDEDSRPAKKQKKSPTLAAPTAASVSPASAAPSRKNVPGIDPITGEKRKRGRPRKVPLPAATAPVQPVAVAPAPQVIMQQPQPQYLLAVFALFSLWSNAPSTQSTNSGSGSVVADAVQPLVNTAGLNFTWMQAVHLMASVAVLASIIIPLARRQFTSRKVQKPEVSASIVNTAEVESDNESEDLASVHSNSSSAGPGTPLTSETEIELTVLLV